MFARFRLPALALLATPATLAAHEGHGPEFSVTGMLHWFLEPTHMAGVVLALALSVAVGVALSRARRAGAAGAES